MGELEKRREYVIDAKAEGQRLDVFLARKEELGLSRSHTQKLIRQGRVTVNGEVGKPSCRLVTGDQVVVEVPQPVSPQVKPQEIPLDIIYEDDDLLVVNKPRGMVVHPAPGHADGTLVNALLAHCDDLSGINDVRRPGIVHRLDRDTTGLLVVAKNDRSHLDLARQIKERRVEREYLALVHGSVPVASGLVEAPVGRHPVHRKKMAVTWSGKPAVTKFWVLERFDGVYSLVRARLGTGRTHQIRVHMAYIGHPVVGDPVYGPKGHRREPFSLKGQALHAQRISFCHPATGERLEFEAPLPEDMKEAIAALRAGKEREQKR